MDHLSSTLRHSLDGIVTDYDTSIKLRDLGISIKNASFYWLNFGRNQILVSSTDELYDDTWRQHCVPAFTTGELGIILSRSNHMTDLPFFDKLGQFWQFCQVESHHCYLSGRYRDEVSARAGQVMFLLGEGYSKPEILNGLVRDTYLD